VDLKKREGLELEASPQWDTVTVAKFQWESWNPNKLRILHFDN